MKPEVKERPPVIWTQHCIAGPDSLKRKGSEPHQLTTEDNFLFLSSPNHQTNLIILIQPTPPVYLK